MRTFRVGLVVAMAAAILAPKAQALTIDDFSDAQQVSQTVVGSNMSTIAIAGSDIASDRKIMVTVDTQVQNLPFTADVAAGDYAMSGPPETLGSQWIEYTLQGPADLTNSGNDNAIGIGIVSNNIPSDFSISVSDNDSSDTATFQTSFTPNPIVENVLHSSFTGIDFTQITEFSVHIDLLFDVGTDLVFNFIETTFVPPPVVPTPAALPAGLGLVGFGYMRRKAQR